MITFVLQKDLELAKIDGLFCKQNGNEREEGRKKPPLLYRGTKSNFIRCVTYLLRATNTEQPYSMFSYQHPLSRSYRLLSKNISRECFLGDRKMTLKVSYGRGMVHSTAVGAPMVPGGYVIHHQQRCRAQQRVTTTISQLS